MILAADGSYMPVGDEKKMSLTPSNSSRDDEDGGLCTSTEKLVTPDSTAVTVVVA